VPDRRVQTRVADDPSFTITASPHLDKRAWLESGRVVQLTPRALARLQSIPDDYILPEGKTLACHVIGNAVPPKMYQKIIEQFQ
jgi:site-specific DNA-cytosine methylase